MTYNVTLLMSEFVTHDVRRFIVSKPDGFSFVPGQGVELAIDNDQWRAQGRPFTPTSLTDDRVLEFVIKRYPAHDSVTEALHTLPAGSRLLMSEPFGTISYQGIGVFIAAGAGVTPFIAIVRDLARRDRLAGHALILSNKTPDDVICEKEFRRCFDNRCTLVCTRTGSATCEYGRVNGDYLQAVLDDFGGHFYVCGPPGFVENVNAALQSLGVAPEALVYER